MPISKNNIIEIGFPYLNKKISHFTNFNHKENIFLIISQPFMSKKLIMFSIKLKKKLKKNIKILYKPHPLEIINNDTFYFKELEKNNIEIIKNYDSDLYRLLSQARWVMGVSSTVLYEALAFKCKVFILNEPGSERLSKLINLKLAFLIKSIDNIEYFLNKTIKKNSISLFYNDNNKKIKSLFKIKKI